MIVDFVTENGRPLKLGTLTFNQMKRWAEGHAKAKAGPDYTIVAHEVIRQVIADSLANGGEAIDAAQLFDILTGADLIGCMREITRISIPAKPKPKFFQRF
ncbi:MAG: hypothetical protein WAN65_15705 [Candidatus Sulfotelmatobacter sp.]